MYYLVLRRYYVPKCSKISKKSAKNSGNHSSKKICEERVICQDIAVVFSNVKKYPTLQCLVKLHFLQKYFLGKSDFTNFLHFFANYRALW